MCLHSNNTKSQLNILSYNVEGLASTLEDPTFTDLIYNHDICLLNETWKDTDSKISLPGLWDYSLIRPKHKKAGRHSGGITVFCKDVLRPGLKVLNSSEGFVWLKLDSKILNLSNDLLICAALYPS
jgi:hypothetical protein